GRRGRGPTPAGRPADVAAATAGRGRPGSTGPPAAGRGPVRPGILRRLCAHPARCSSHRPEPPRHRHPDALSPTHIAETSACPLWAGGRRTGSASSPLASGPARPVGHRPPTPPPNERWRTTASQPAHKTPFSAALTVTLHRAPTAHIGGSARAYEVEADHTA